MTQNKNDRFLEVLEDTLGFVLKRQKDSGGFGLTPNLPATLEDTYHALKLLEISSKYGLKTFEQIDKDKHINYLLSKLENIFNLPPKAIYQLTSSLHILKAQDVLYKGNFLPSVLSERIEDLYYFLKYSQVFSLKDKVVLELKKKVFPFSGVMKKRFMALYLDYSINNKAITNSQKVVSWIQLCQNSDGGFGFMPGTTSFIENVFWAINALVLLRQTPKDIEGLLSYIYSCRTKSGGFARKANAAPFLDASFYAVCSIDMLMKN